MQIDKLIDRSTVVRMNVLKVSPKYQVVIPQKIREAIGLRCGERVQVFAFRNRIEIVPIRSLRQLRGLAKGINTSLEREGDRL